MSDEFTSLATKEINEEISEIETILNSCKNDEDVSQNSTNLQRHTHKIKGLAPMMGKEELGSFSDMLDSILKKMINGVTIDGIFSIFCDSISSMKQCMIEPDYNFEKIKFRISQIRNTLD